MRTLAQLPRAVLVYHSAYRAPPNPFSDTRRAAKVLDYLMYEGCIHRHHMLRPSRATIRQLNLVHPYQYLAQVGGPEQVERVFGQDVFELDAQAFIEQQRWMVGGTIRAARYALSLLGPRVAVNLGGGLHHAYADGGLGFCVFNDVAIAIHQLRRDGYDKRILVIDLDLHQGDGTRQIFGEDASVFTFSIHAENWDEEPLLADFNLAIGLGVGDETYLRIVREHLPRVFKQFQPHLVFYVAGVDTAADDKLGSWRLSADGLLRRDQVVHGLIGPRPSVWLTGGGYGLDAWRYTARSLAWMLCGHDSPIPSSQEEQIQRFRGIANSLGVDELSASGAGAENFGISESDIFLDLAGPKTPSKVLGFYSAYGLECALERYGVLEHIRQLGIPRTEVTIELDHPTGQLMRLRTEDAQHDLLIELVLGERFDTPDVRLLWLEWLVAQNPRRQPTQDRPLLPGQQHPGLGCLPQIVGMLMMACERLEYDGIAFNPAHFHVAALGKAWAYFADPRYEARFRAMETALAGLAPVKASSLAADGSLIDASSGEAFVWEPARMVIPVSHALHSRFTDAEYDDAVREAAAILHVARAS